MFIASLILITPEGQVSGPLRFQLALALALRGEHEVAEPLLVQVLRRGDLAAAGVAWWIWLRRCGDLVGAM